MNYEKNVKWLNWKCNDEKKSCDEIQYHLEKSLARTVLPFKNKDEHDFDQPTAARYLLGMIKYANDITQRDLETLHPMVSNDVLNLFFNCKKASVEEILEKPIARDHAEVSFSQNLLDQMFIPHEISIDMKDILNSPEIKKVFDRHPEWKGMLADGQIALVRDPKIIDQLNFTDSSSSNKSVRPPKITNTTNQRLSTLSPRKVQLDNIEIH